MKKNLNAALVIALLVSACNLPVDPPFPNSPMDEPPDPTTIEEVWDMTYSKPGWVTNESTVRGFGGEYFTAGLRRTDANGFVFNPFIAKVSSDGVALWEIEFDEKLHTNEMNAPMSVLPNSDGGAMVIIVSSPLYAHRNKIIRLNRFGETVWEKELGFDGKAWSMSWRQDGSFLVAGYIGQSDGSGSGWIANYNQDGSQIWSKNVAGGSEYYGSKVISTSDGGFLVVSPSNIRLIYIHKFNAANALEWSRTSVKGDVKKVIQSRDGNFIFLHSRPGYYEYNELRKISVENGDEIWVVEEQTRKSKDEHAHDIVELSNGSIIAVGDATGNIVGYTGGQFDGWVIEFDKNGQYVQQRCFGARGFDSARSVILINDNELIFTGVKNSGEDGLWALKFSMY